MPLGYIMVMRRCSMRQEFLINNNYDIDKYNYHSVRQDFKGGGLNSV